MPDCLHSDSYEEDLEVTLVHNKFNDVNSLNDFTFTGYDYDLNDQKIVSILNLDRLKVSIESTDDNNFNILFDNKPYFVIIKVYCAWIKKLKTWLKANVLKVRIHLLHQNLGFFFQYQSTRLSRNTLVSFFRRCNEGIIRAWPKITA